jgi:hypothetical protein
MTISVPETEAYGLSASRILPSSSGLSSGPWVADLLVTPPVYLLGTMRGQESETNGFLRLGGDSLPFVKGRGGGKCRGIFPRAPWDFSLSGGLTRQGRLQPPPSSPRWGQRSGRIPAVPYPLLQR